jgi:hypothetical protein
MTPSTYFLRWIVVGLLFVAPIYVLLFLIWKK